MSTGMFFTTWLLISFSFNFFLIKAFESKGFYAITDTYYNGAIPDGAKTKYLLGTKYLHAERPSDGVRECKNLCLQKNCQSFVINRLNRLCYVTSFNRCVNSRVYFRRIPEYTTYEIVPGALQPSDGIKTTCFQSCLATENCGLCGRRYCTGVNCESCKKTCWEIPLIVNSTYFWPDLRTVIITQCYKAWQTVYRLSISTSYAYLFQFPLWLNVVIHVSDGTTYNSYFDSFEMSELNISVGNYLGGTAGNDWNAPFANLSEVYNNGSNCAPFFYQYTNCSIPQIDSIKTQVTNNITVFKRGYVWTICGNGFGNKTVLDIEFRVTPINETFLNDSSFVNSLVKVDCTPTTTTYTTSTTTDTTTMMSDTTPTITLNTTITMTDPISTTLGSTNATTYTNSTSDTTNAMTDTTSTTLNTTETMSNTTTTTYTTSTT